MNTQQQRPVRVILFLTFVLTLSVGARSGSAQLGVSRSQIDGEPAESNRSPADSWPPNAELLTIHNAELNTTADMILLDNTVVGMLFPNAKRYDINSFLRFALADQPQPEDKKKFWISKPWLASVSPPVGQTRPEAVSQNTGIIGAYRYVTFGSNGAVSASPWTRQYSTRTVGTIKHQFGWYEYAYESFDGRYILHFNGMYDSHDPGQFGSGISKFQITEANHYWRQRFEKLADLKAEPPIPPSSIRIPREVSYETALVFYSGARSYRGLLDARLHSAMMAATTNSSVDLGTITPHLSSIDSIRVQQSLKYEFAKNPPAVQGRIIDVYAAIAGAASLRFFYQQISRSAEPTKRQLHEKITELCRKQSLPLPPEASAGRAEWRTWYAKTLRALR